MSAYPVAAKVVEHATVDGDGPCPECGAEWAYTWTYPGTTATLQASRASTVTGGLHPAHLLCPDCGVGFARPTE